MNPPAFEDSNPEEWTPTNAVVTQLREKVQEVGQNKVLGWSSPNWKDSCGCVFT